MVTSFIKMKEAILKELEVSKRSGHTVIFHIAYVTSLEIVTTAESEFYYQSLKEAGYF